MGGLVVSVLEPEIVEVVGETGKATVGVDPFVAGRGAGVGDMLKCAFDIEGEIIGNEEF